MEERSSSFPLFPAPTTCFLSSSSSLLSLSHPQTVALHALYSIHYFMHVFFFLSSSFISVFFSPHRVCLISASICIMHARSLFLISPMYAFFHPATWDITHYCGSWQILTVTGYEWWIRPPSPPRLLSAAAHFITDTRAPRKLKRKRSFPQLLKKTLIVPSGRCFTPDPQIASGVSSNH